MDDSRRALNRAGRLLVILVAAACLAPTTVRAQDASTSESLLFSGAWLLDGTGTPAVEDAWMHMVGDRIEAIGTGAPPSIPGARTIDLTGFTVLPGLADMHVHLGALPQARWMLKVLLAHGVTRIKDAGGRLGSLAAIRDWVRETEDTPRVYYSGVTLNGNRLGMQFLPEGSSVASQLNDNEAFGADFIKIHNWVSTKALHQIADFARTHDRYLTGHVPLGMTSVTALDAGMKILEHIRMRPSEVLDDPEILAQFQLDQVVMRRTAFWAYLDPDAAPVRRTLDAWSKRDFFLDPTLVVQEAVPLNDYSTDPQYKLLSPATLASWEANATRYGDLADDELEQVAQSVVGMQAFVGRAHARGIPILTGTDTPVVGVVPGVSLHRELELLVGGGLSPEEAVQSSTEIASRALRDPERGVLRAGMIADLVIVRGDLGADIRSIRQVDRVVLGGRILDPQELLREARLEAARHLPTG
jgi:Amidohydrolase family